MNAVMERWVGTCRRELLDRMLIWNQAHLLRALREFEIHYNLHRPHRSLDRDAPLRSAPESIIGSADIVDLNVRTDSATSCTSMSTQPDLRGWIIGTHRRHLNADCARMSEWRPGDRCETLDGD